MSNASRDRQVWAALKPVRGETNWLIARSGVILASKLGPLRLCQNLVKVGRGSGGQSPVESNLNSRVTLGAWQARRDRLTWGKGPLIQRTSSELQGSKQLPTYLVGTERSSSITSSVRHEEIYDISLIQNQQPST